MLSSAVDIVQTMLGEPYAKELWKIPFADKRISIFQRTF
jgi:hypothetical protein